MSSLNYNYQHSLPICLCIQFLKPLEISTIATNCVTKARAQSITPGFPRIVIYVLVENTLFLALVLRTCKTAFSFCFFAAPHCQNACTACGVLGLLTWPTCMKAWSHLIHLDLLILRA